MTSDTAIQYLEALLGQLKSGATTVTSYTHSREAADIIDADRDRIIYPTGRSTLTVRIENPAVVAEHKSRGGRVLRQCCERDKNWDGDCDVHPRKSILNARFREVVSDAAKDVMSRKLMAAGQLGSPIAVAEDIALVAAKALAELPLFENVPQDSSDDD